MASEDRDRAAWVRRQPCAVARMHGSEECWGMVEAHHAGPRGLGQKAHDDTCIPLCSRHHRCWHDLRWPFSTMGRDDRLAWVASEIERARKHYEWFQKHGDEENQNP